MASAPLVITDSTGVVNATGAGNLFDGLSFFILRRVPQRSRFLNDVEANGGRVVAKEADADYVIADHARSDAPGGSYSYTFIEAAVKTGQLPDPGQHATGAPRVREVASNRPSKATRVPFTRDDDLFLWNFVQKERANGAAEFGNVLYQRLEAANPRHTFQSWRDRYKKRISQNPPASEQPTVSANPPPSPPIEPEDQQLVQAGPQPLQTGSVKVTTMLKEPAERPSVEAEPGQRQPAKPISAQKEPVLGPHAPREPARKRRVSKIDGVDESAKSRGLKASDFSQEDFDSLMQNAEDIENIDEERRDEAWAVWAASRNHHTAGKWYWLWQEQVRPMYLGVERPDTSTSNKRMKKLYTVDDFEKHIISPTRSKSEALSSDATSGKQQSKYTSDMKAGKLSPESGAQHHNASLQQHIAPYVEVHENPTAGNRHEMPQIANEIGTQTELQAAEAVAISDLPLAGERLAAASREHDESQEPVVTSHANHLGQIPIRGDDHVAERSISVLHQTLTSEANEGADTQLQRESTVHAPKSQSDEVAMVSSEANASADTQLDLERPSDARMPDDLPGTMRLAMQSQRRYQTQGRSLQRSPSTFESDHGNPSWTRAEEEAVPSEMQLGRNASHHAESNFSRTGHSASAVKAQARKLFNRDKDRSTLSSSTASHTPKACDAVANEAASDAHEAMWAPDDEDDGDIAMHGGHGNLLTEANLVTEQEQHMPKISRAVDLPQDDENKDQSDLVHYLQGILDIKQAPCMVDLANYDDQDAADANAIDELGPAPNARKTGSIDYVEQEDKEDEEEQDEEEITYPDTTPRPLTAVPLSSQREIDEALDRIMDWPNSPEQRQQNNDDSGFATQMEYPHLRPQPWPLEEVVEHEPAARSPTDKHLSQLRSELPGHESGGSDYGSKERGFTRTERTAPAMLDHEDEHHWIMGKRKPEAEAEDDALYESEIDLEVPSPPGGFGSFEAASPSKPRANVFHEDEANDDENEMHVKSAAVEIVDISSRASSSSYHSSEHEQTQNEEPMAAAQPDKDEGPLMSQDELEPKSPRVRRHAIETQDILNAQTQAPEFDMPLPPSSEPDLGPERSRQTSPAAGPQSPVLQPVEPAPEEEAEEKVQQEDHGFFIKKMSDAGFASPDIIYALQRSSCHHELARLILLDQKAGRGLPQGLPGIWSEQEDEELMSTDATVLKRLARTKGELECDFRRQFLEEA